jgi:hypothetical protein
LRCPPEGYWDSTFGLRKAAASSGGTPIGVSPGQWQHIALVYRDRAIQVYRDGRLGWIGDLGFDGTFLNASPLRIGGREEVGASQPEALPFAGFIDDAVILDRALSTTELGLYVRSQHPCGQSLVPGARADFGDVRVVQTSTQFPAVETPHEVIGVRPYTGAVLTWNLGGTATGRFGDPDGASEFDGVAAPDDTGYVPELAAGAAFSVQIWARHEVVVPTPQTLIGVDSDAGAIGLEIQDGLPRFVVREAGGNTVVVAGSVTTADGQWHHDAGVFDAAAGLARLYVDGRPAGTAVVAAVSGGGVGGPSLLLGASVTAPGPAQSFVGTLDDAVFHLEAVSRDTLFHRVHPGVPVAGFLANTEQWPDVAGDWPWMQYALHWLNPAATYSRPQLISLDGQDTCVGLLSPCLGTVAWWRFEDSAPDDDSTLKHQTIQTEPYARVEGLVGSAAPFDGGPELTIASHPALDTETFTIEARVSPAASGPILAHGATGASARLLVLAASQPTLPFEELPGGRPTAVMSVMPSRHDDAAELAATLAHEVAHAWRRHHDLEVEDRLEEERLTDVATVFLGFGVLTANGSYRYRSSGGVVGLLAFTEYQHKRAGYLPPQAMSFLLAAQARALGATGKERRSITRRLEPNQRGYFDAAWEALGEGPPLRIRLGIPEDAPRSALPEPRAVGTDQIVTHEEVVDQPEAPASVIAIRTVATGPIGYTLWGLTLPLAALAYWLTEDGAVVLLVLIAMPVLALWNGSDRELAYCPSCAGRSPIDVTACRSCKIPFSALAEDGMEYLDLVDHPEIEPDP